MIAVFTIREKRDGFLSDWGIDNTPVRCILVSALSGLAREMLASHGKSHS